MKNRILSFILPLLAVSFAWAQAPAAPEKTAQQVITPPGYKRIDVAGKKVICLPDDEKWVKEVIATVPAVTHPTTRPADLVDRIKANRDKLSAQMVTELPGLTPAAVSDFLDKDLTPDIVKLRDIKIDLVYIVTPREPLVNAMRAGWSATNLYYNRISDTIEFNPAFTPDSNTGESAVPIGYMGTDTEKDRAAKIVETIKGINQTVEEQLASRGFMLMKGKFYEFINAKGFGEEKTFLSRLDQVWFREGLGNILAVKYMCQVGGLPMEGVMQTFWVVPQNVNVNPLTLDLLHPQPLEAYQPQFLGSVLDGRIRRATFAMWTVYSKDPTKVAVLLTEIRAKNPADGPTLAETVKAATGVDPAPLLKAQQ